MNRICLTGGDFPAGNGEDSARILAGGDFCPLRNFEKKLLRGGKILSPELEREIAEHDLFLINLEAPLCAAPLPPFSHNGHGLRCDPRLADALAKLGVGAAGLANNHILDFRAEGLFQTVENLRNAGIPATGAGRDLADAERPLAIVRNGLSIGIWALAEKELNCADDKKPGSSFFSPERNLARIPELGKRFDFLLVYLHAGHEFTRTPSPRIRAACRAFADAGADLVVCHHPHVVQGMEKRGAAWIAYSLGNFVFDSDYVARYDGTKQSFLLSASIGRHRIDRLDVIPCVIGNEWNVAPLSGSSFAEFRGEFERLCSVLGDDRAYAEAWENDVRFRWDTEYRRIIRDFPCTFFDPSNRDFAIRAGNLFTCPTHLEMFREIFRMLEEGKLSR